MGGVVAGIAAVAVVILILLLVLCIVKRRDRSKYDLSKTSKMEMGTTEPSKPILGGKWCLIYVGPLEDFDIL